MGCFGYICPVCDTQIVGGCWGGGEICRLKHVRNGEVVGEVVGAYNEYGTVMDEEIYRGKDKLADGSPNPNSHSEICNSEFGLRNSYHFGSRRVLPDGAVVDTYYGFNFEVYNLSESSDLGKVLKLYRETPKGQEDAELIDKIFSFADDYFDQHSEDPSKFGEALDFFHEFSKWDNPENRALSERLGDYIDELPIDQGQSGTIAVHELCYQSLTEEEKQSLPFSKSDPDQSWGTPRKKFQENVK